MHNGYKTVAVRLGLHFQFTHVQYCKTIGRLDGLCCVNSYSDTVRLTLVCPTLCRDNFLFNVISSWDLHKTCHLSYVLRNEISLVIDESHRISHYTSIVKLAHFWQRHVCTWNCQRRTIFKMGIYRESLHLLSDETANPFPTTTKKNVDTYHVSFSSE